MFAVGAEESGNRQRFACGRTSERADAPPNAVGREREARGESPMSQSADGSNGRARAGPRGVDARRIEKNVCPPRTGRTEDDDTSDCIYTYIRLDRPEAREF